MDSDCQQIAEAFRTMSRAAMAINEILGRRDDLNEWSSGLPVVGGRIPTSVSAWPHITRGSPAAHDDSQDLPRL